MELKNICFVRHAKSSWEDLSLSDIDRPLNSRGLRDAPFMAAKMSDLSIIPDLLVSSPANRALSTCRHFADQFNISHDDIQIEDDIYGASPQEIFEIVTRIPKQYQSVFLFGHNPTMTYVANSFAGISIDNVPTCGISQVKTMVDSWSKFSPDTSAYVAFYYPKQYL